MSDAPDAFCAVLRKARKQHHCCECMSPIMPGEIYEYASGVWVGTGQSFKTCTPCAEFRQQFLEDLYSSHWDNITIFGHLQCEASEFYGWKF